jgi:hypothetical protein
MFTIIAFLGLAAAGWWSNRREASERTQKAVSEDDDFLRARIVFIRQDVRLLAYLLAAILIMLGIIADRLH